MSVGKIILLILLGVLVIWGLSKFLSMFKFPKTDTLTLVHGGVKTGKTTVAVSLAVQNHRRNLRRVRFANMFRKMFGFTLWEEPLLYSNIPLSCPYVPLTKELLLRKTRFVYGSTILISEASLVADSQLIKDKVINERLLKFFKLCGHELRGKGAGVILDTQCISDVHYSIKRCLSSTLYIDKLVKWLPGLLIAYVREERYAEDGDIMNVYNEDVEDSMKRVLIPKKNWKLFDSCCYSAFTDGLPVVKKETQALSFEDLKVNDKTILSFREWCEDEEGMVNYETK